MKWLLLGAKEYPFGAGSLDDPLPSSGSELLQYVKDVGPEYVYCVHGDDAALQQ